jgi:acetoacetyl-CoA reductase
VDRNIHIYPVDVSCFDSCSGLIKQVGIDFGNISVLINNAGITCDSSIKKMEYEQWTSVISVNLGSVFNLSKLVFESMCDQGWGRIVNISSINGQKGQFGQVNYSAAKAGMLGFTKSLAYEGARFGVTVNTVSPGYIGTNMVTSLSDKVLNSIVSAIPLGRLGTTDEVAHAVLFLLSEESGFITGSNIAVNGGQHMF